MKEKIDKIIPGLDVVKISLTGKDYRIFCDELAAENSVEITDLQKYRNIEIEKLSILSVIIVREKIGDVEYLRRIDL